MKHFAQFLVGFAILALVISAPVYNSDFDRRAKTLIDTKSISSDGNYYYKFYVDTGIAQEVAGTLKIINGVKFYSVTGSYSHLLDNGKKLTVKYIADENGFRILSLDEKYLSYPQPVINLKAVASLLGG